jgi:hypothetical protein
MSQEEVMGGNRPKSYSRVSRRRWRREVEKDEYEKKIAVSALR